MDIQDILDKLRITDLNAMQQDVAQCMMQTRDDIIILSPTGSGKTLAYMLPAIFQMQPAVDALQTVVLVPSRELAKQSAEVFRSTGCGMRHLSLYGGRPTMEEHREINNVHPQIVFATPGRMNDHIDKGNIGVKGVRLLIIDEFDKCLEMGFADEMQHVIERLPGVERRILLSATDCPEIPRFVSMGSTQRIDYISHTTDLDTDARIRQYMVRSEQKDKLEKLSMLLRSFGTGSSIVFLNYRESVERTAQYLKDCGFVVSAYHGGYDQKQREDALYKFSNGSANVMVCTDLASRGLDIPDVDNIVHYHLPQGEAEYVHRIGRTARWDAVGRTFVLLGPQEQLPEYLDQDMPLYEVPADVPQPSMPRMATIYIGKGKKDKISKSDVLGFLCKKCRLQGSDIGRIDVADRYCYAAVKREKVKTVLRLAAGEKIKGVKTLFEEVR